MLIKSVSRSRILRRAAFVLGTALASSSAGCTTLFPCLSDPPKTITTVTKVIDGNPKVGSIYHVKQTHDPDIMMKYDREQYRKEYLDNEEARVSTLYYQLHILMFLQRHNFREVFPESLDRTAKSDFIDKEFGRPTPNSYSYQFALHRHIISRGGAVAYGLITPGVNLHKTAPPSSAEIEQKIVEAIKRDDTNSFNYYAMVVREHYAMYEVYSFLQDNPGKKVAITFGEAHDFSDEIERFFEELPVFYTVDFPRAAHLVNCGINQEEMEQLKQGKF
jgi:hypothetical protein